MLLVRSSLGGYRKPWGKVNLCSVVVCASGGVCLCDCAHACHACMLSNDVLFKRHSNYHHPRQHHHHPSMFLKIIHSQGNILVLSRLKSRNRFMARSHTNNLPTPINMTKNHCGGGFSSFLGATKIGHGVEFL